MNPENVEKLLEKLHAEHETSMKIMLAVKEIESLTRLINSILDRLDEIEEKVDHNYAAIQERKISEKATEAFKNKIFGTLKFIAGLGMFQVIFEVLKTIFKDKP